jgi:F0F1-type ATP synthase assembly protein I
MLTFFTIEGSSITTMLGYVGDFITDSTPLMLPIMGIGIGIIIVVALIGAIKR